MLESHYLVHFFRNKIYEANLFVRVSKSVQFLQVKFIANYIQAFNTYRRNKEHDVPMTGTASLMRLGNTSATVHSVLRNAVTGVHYGSFEILYVLVDTQTRRPIPFPKTLRQKYSIDERLAKNTDDKLGVTTQTSDSLVKTADTDDNPKKASKRNNKPIKVVTTGDIPEDSVIVWNKVTIQPHMIDSNEHTNIDFYQELALEVLGKALKQGIFPEYAHINSSEDINVREILLHFHGESLLGDILHVGVWHEDHQKDIFQCVIKKHGQVLVTLQIHLLEKISSKVMANI